MSDYLVHYGTLGMKWGIRRYQNPDGTLTDLGKKHYSHSGRFPIREERSIKGKNLRDNLKEVSDVVTDAFSELKSLNFKQYIPVQDQRAIAKQLANKLNLDMYTSEYLTNIWFNAIRRDQA